MEKLLRIAWEGLNEKKASEPIVLDLKELGTVTDYFIICSGQSQVQVRAIADNIFDQMKAADLPLPKKEGYAEGRWVLLDFGNLVVHILQESERSFYKLEDLWHDAKVVKL